MSSYLSERKQYVRIPNLGVWMAICLIWWHSWHMMQVGLCTLLMTLNQTFSLWFQKTTGMYRANFYVNIEKLLCFVDY